MSASTKAAGALVVLLSLLALPAQAQVSIDISGSQITLSNAGYAPQTIVQMPDGWYVQDDNGDLYPLLGYQYIPGGGDAPDHPICAAGDGYLSNAPVHPELITYYPALLDYLRTSHGVVTMYNAALGMDILVLEGKEDSLMELMIILTTDTFGGRPLIEYFKSMEIISLGSYYTPSDAVLPTPAPYAFPDDPYYKLDWGFDKAKFDVAQWHPAEVQQQVTVSVIDSGVAGYMRDDPSLAGITHIDLQPGVPAPHALGLLSLLNGPGHDGMGTIGLLGTWESEGCYGGPSLTTRMAPQIYSFGVGPTGPSPVSVAEAIHESIALGADVINLSMKLSTPAIKVSEAIDAALDAGITVVASAGNQTTKAYFPASHPGVISVGAASQNKKLASFSASEGIDVSAPGEDVIVLGGNGEYRYIDGTSQAAIYVTAAAAMVRAVAKGSTGNNDDEGDHSGDNDSVLDILQRTTKEKKGVSFIDVEAALDEASGEDGGKLKAPHKCKQNGSYIVAPEQVAGLQGTTLGDVAAGTSAAETPDEVTLGNYPNPFNPVTTIRFALPARQQVRLVVYNALGQAVAVLADGLLEAGAHEAHFEGHQMASGMYFSRLETPNGVLTQTMILMK